MSNKIVNLTWEVVTQEIEDVLEAYPEYPYQAAFAIPELRQKLVAYVLSRVSNDYTVMDDQEEQPSRSQHAYLSLKERLHIEVLIRAGIHQILREKADWISQHIPKMTNSGFAPSNWFG